jgi:lipopolysaccharide export system permease protein
MTHRLITPDGSKGPISPKLEKNIQDPLVMTQWPETPWKLIKPGLRAEQLGIPGLYSWLVQNRTSEWGNKRRFLTQWHYRWAQPGICLAIVLLAAPLGIVFSRRGAAGGIALAIFMCAGIMFSSTVFLALGESGYIPPVWAAWGTNILATSVALLLIQLRLVGRPIYQTLRKLLPV